MLTEQEKKNAVKVYHETSSLTKVRRSFSKCPGYQAKNLPSLRTLRHVVEKFTVHRGVQDRRKGRKSSIKEAEVKKGETLYGSSQLLSLRTASRKGIHDSPPEDSEEGLKGKNTYGFNRKAVEDQDCSLQEFAPEKRHSSQGLV